MDTLKECKKCGEVKPLAEFYINGGGRAGFQCSCKVCCLIANRARYAAHPEKIAVCTKKWRVANAEKVAADNKKWVAANSGRVTANHKRWLAANPHRRAAHQKAYEVANAEKIAKRKKTYALANPERIADRGKSYYATNREKVNAVSRAWQISNPGKVAAINNRWRATNCEKVAEAKKKRRSTPFGKLNSNMSRGICRSLKRDEKAGRRWEMLVPYSVEQLMKHIEKQFKPGMSWENHGSCWHLDHRIPKAVFNFETPNDIDFHRCWALENLQPLWATENLSKQDRICKSFQPSLAMG